MEFENQVVFVISIGFLILTSISVKGSDLMSPSSSDVKDTFGSSSFDLDKFEEALGPIPSLDEVKQAVGSVSSLEEAKEALSPVVANAKEALGPVSSLEALSPVVDEAKQALGPISPSTLDKAKSISSKALDKVGQGFESIASWISQNKEQISVSSSIDLDKAKEALGPILPATLEKAKEALGPISPATLEKAKEALPPISPSIVDEAKDALGPISSEAIDEAKDKFGSIMSLFSQNKEEVSSNALDEAKEKFGSLFSQNKEEIKSDSSSSISPSMFDNAKSLDEAKEKLGPVSPSTLDAAEEAIGSISSKALDEAKQTFGSITSFFSQNKEDLSSIYIDHDVALAIESLIKQGQLNSQLAVEEAKKVLSDTETIASPDTGTCVKKCMESYASCLDRFNKAMEQLRARNAQLLKNDVTAVEGDISTCQNCFLENTKENQSSLKELNQAIIKATRECLNVLHHSG